MKPIFPFRQSRNVKRRSFRELISNRDGVSAVEFALIAPVMILIYFAVIELSFVMQVDRKVTTATSTLGDLVARSTIVTDNDLDDIFEATRMIFQPLVLTNARLRVSSLSEDSGTVTVDWSDEMNWSAHVEGSTMVVPANLVPDGGSVILAEIEYDYTSSLGYFISSGKTLTDTFYLRPRSVNFISRVDS